MSIRDTDAPQDWRDAALRLGEELDVLSAELERREQPVRAYDAMRQWLRHSYGCNAENTLWVWERRERPDCTCGMDAAIAEIRGSSAMSLRNRWDWISGGCIGLMLMAIHEGYSDTAAHYATFIAGDLWRVFWKQIVLDASPKGQQP